VLLRDVLSVQTYCGETAVGPDLAAPRSVSGKATLQRELVRDSAGSEVLSSLTAYVRPEDADIFTPGSLVTYGGLTAVVISKSINARPGEPVVTKVMAR
jgi:hypothetical protein